MRYLRTLITVMLTLSGAVHAAGAQESVSNPNVLFIAVDDLRTSLGCYGDPIAKTPNMDALAESALLFTRAYTQQSVCGPARTAMLTGRLPDNNRVWHNRNLFRDTHPDLVTLPQLFKNNGYHTQALGKVFSGRGSEAELDPPSWSVPPLLSKPDWKKYVLPVNTGVTGKGTATECADVTDEAYEDGQLSKLAVETLEQLQRSSQPFFLAVGFFKPHLPFNAPKKYWDLYDPTVFQLDAQTSRTKGAPDVAYPDHLEMGGYKDIPKDEKVTVDKARELRHGYYACVSYTDAQVGKVLAELKRLGLDKNTIVVLWGDHGFSLGEAGHWCKDTNFEMDTRVPLIIRTPDITEKGITTGALVEYVDVYPTLAELADLPAPDGLDGVSLAPVLQDPKHPGKEVVLSQFSRPFKPSEPEVMGYSIRTDNFRYTRWVVWPNRKTFVEELYDYTSDLSVEQENAFLIERTNMIQHPDYLDKRDQLRIQMEQVLRQRIHD
jgi:iduronate 2-sulfatase